MLARDLSSGRLIAVPDSHVFASPPGGYRLGSYAPGFAHGVGSVSGLGHYGAPPAQIIYDGLGHPLGLPFLTALPPLARRVAALLPQVATAASKVLPLLQSTGAMPQGQPAPVPAPDMMVSPSMPPPMQPSMQVPLQPPMQPSMPSLMESPIQPTMAPAVQEPMQEPMSPPMQASAQLPMPPSMPPMAPPPSEPRSPETVAPPEPFVAPLRVQQGNGRSVVIPMRWRVRRRPRLRRFVLMQPAIPRRPLPPGGYVPGPAAPARYLHGWAGFNGWSRY
jgi:hypothetical protein